jgi:ADP-heptose:LPS heptosyltransferase
MNVDFMRIVDKWVGVPLCFLLSLVDAVLRRSGRKAEKRHIQKILFVQLSEMGSTISAHSALRKAQKLFPEAELYYFIFAEMQESIKLLNIIPESNIFTVPSKSLTGFCFGSLRLILEIRKLNIDAVVDLELFSRASILFSYCFGAPVRTGFHRFHMEGLYRGSLLTHKVIYNHLKHISSNFLSLVYALQVDNREEPFNKLPCNKDDIVLPKITPSAEAKERMLAKLHDACPEVAPDKKIVLLNPNGSALLPLRRWPLERYCDLAKRLLVDPGVVIVVTGVASEKKDAAHICDTVQDRRCINFAGQTTLRELIDIYAVSALLVSNDSGPPNFASLTGIKVLVLFGPETPQCYAPLGDTITVVYADYMCSPCVSAYNPRESACNDNKCLQAISVDDVCERIRTLVPGLLL